MRGLERFLSALTPQQTEIAGRRLARGQAIPADLASYAARAAALRRGATGRHSRKAHPPMDDETRQAIAWVLRHTLSEAGRLTMLRHCANSSGGPQCGIA